MSILCMTGWQQPADALSEIASAAEHFDYSAYNDVAAMFAALAPSPDLAIGWSLGGQLLVRAIAAGRMKPAALMLLGSPFQWVRDSHFTHGVPRPVADEVRASYSRDPGSMLEGFHTLIAHGDDKEKFIIRKLNMTSQVWKHGGFWLDELYRASCVDLDFSGFPPVILVHGLEDKVILPINAQLYHDRLPKCERILWPGCAHAPHLHNPQALRAAVEAYV